MNSCFTVPLPPDMTPTSESALPTTLTRWLYSVSSRSSLPTVPVAGADLGDDGVGRCDHAIEAVVERRVVEQPADGAARILERAIIALVRASVALSWS